MKCPLFIINDRRAQSGEETQIGDCLKEKCAWYYGVYGQCSIYILSSRLDEMNDKLEHIANGLRR